MCPSHGGAAPQVQAAAAQRRAYGQAQADLRRLLDDPMAPPVADPLEALARLATRLQHAVDVLDLRIGELPSVGVTTLAGGVQLRAEVKIWELLLGHLRAALDSLARAGFAERQTTLAEQQAETLGALVAAALDSAGVTGAERVRAIGAARDRFVLIHGAVG